MVGGWLALEAVVMSYNWDGYRNQSQDRRPGCPDWHHNPTAGRHRAAGEADCPVGRPSQTPKLPPDARSEAQSGPGASTSQGATQTPAARLCPIPHDAHPPSGACGGAVSRLRDPLVRRLGPAHSGGHRPAPGSGAGNRARLPGPAPVHSADAAVFPKHNWTAW